MKSGGEETQQDLEEKTDTMDVEIPETRTDNPSELSGNNRDLGE